MPTLERSPLSPTPPRGRPSCFPTQKVENTRARTSSMSTAPISSSSAALAARTWVAATGTGSVRVFHASENAASSRRACASADRCRARVRIGASRSVPSIVPTIISVTRANNVCRPSPRTALTPTTGNPALTLFSPSESRSRFVSAPISGACVHTAIAAAVSMRALTDSAHATTTHERARGSARPP